MKSRKDIFALVSGIIPILGCGGIVLLAGYFCGPLAIDIIRHTILENPSFLRPPVGELVIPEEFNNRDTELILLKETTLEKPEKYEGMFGNIFVIEEQDALTRTSGDIFSFLDLNSFTFPLSEQSLSPYSLDSDFEFGIIDGNAIVWDALVHEGYIYANPDTPGDKDFIVVLAPPDSKGLRLVDKFQLDAYVRDFVVMRDLLYVADTDESFYVFNISDPGKLDLIAYHEGIDGLGVFTDLFVVGDYIYAVVGDIYVLDFSDPQQPYVVSRFESHYTYYPSRGKFMVSGDKAYLEEVYKHGGSYLSVLNISNPSNPSYIKTYDLCVFCDEWTVIGDIFYLLYSENPYLAPTKNPKELHLFDFSDARSQQYIGGMQLGEGGWRLTPMPLNQLLMTHIKDDEYRLYLYEYVP